VELNAIEAKVRDLLQQESGSGTGESAELPIE
jgi:hypothetical protein